MSKNGLPMQRNIGAIQDNRPKTSEDREFAKIVNSVNMELLKLSFKGKPKSVEEMNQRVSDFFDTYAKYGLNPTVERSCYRS